MDILGIGGFEMLVILLIMILVAGPKRMITWSYQLGKYISVIRNMWSETAKQLQKELDSSGVDVKIPTDIPTRQSITKELGRIAAPMTKPLEEIKKDLKVTVDDVRSPMGIKAPAPKPAPQIKPPPAAESNGNGDFGTWSNGTEQK